MPADNPHRLAPGNYICLSISDTGSGMDEETLRRAVEPFYTTKGIGRGTGLGLSIVDGLAEQLGGRLTLESQPGVGTTANIWIPAVPRTRKAPVRAMARRRSRPAKASGCACPVEYWWWTTTRWC